MTDKTEDRIFLIGTAIAAYFLVIKPAMDGVLQATGLQETNEERQARQQLERIDTTLTPFSPQYWRDMNRRFGEVYILTVANTNDFMSRIYNALNRFGGDDEAAILAVFRSLRYKTQVSYLAEQFAKRYNQSLIDYLQNGPSRGIVIPDAWRGLSLTEMNRIFNIVNSLPDGKK